MKTLSFATTAYAFAAIVALTVAANADAPKPQMIADGVSSPVTHLLEVTNAPVLQASKTDTVHGTLAERPSPVRKTDTVHGTLAERPSPVRKTDTALNK